MPNIVSPAALPDYGNSYILNGTEIKVGNYNPPALPAQLPEDKDPEQPWLWPTSRMAYLTNVMMTNGQTWRVNRPPVIMQDGVVQISMAKAGTTLSVVVFVDSETVDTPIWYTGALLPEIEVVEGQPVEAEAATPDLPTQS